MLEYLHLTTGVPWEVWFIFNLFLKQFFISNPFCFGKQILIKVICIRGTTQNHIGRLAVVIISQLHKWPRLFIARKYSSSIISCYSNDSHDSIRRCLFNRNLPWKSRDQDFVFFGSDKVNIILALARIWPKIPVTSCPTCSMLALGSLYSEYEARNYLAWNDWMSSLPYKKVDDLYRGTSDNVTASVQFHFRSNYSTFP